MATDYFINVKDSDLMQMMHEQDVDLGFDWNNFNEPVKPLKNIDDLQNSTSKGLDITDFFVDGETGEHIPITRKSPLQESKPQSTQLPQESKQSGGNNNTFNIDECLEILENSFDNVQPQKIQDQTSMQNQTEVIRNLNSLIHPSENPAPTQPNEDVWQHIAGLSQLTGLNLPTQNSQALMQAQGVVDVNARLQNLTHPQLPVAPAIMDEPLNTYNSPPNYVDQVYEPSPVFEPPIASQYNITATSFHAPTFSPPGSTPPNHFMSSPISSDDGIPMDVNFPSMDGSSKQQEPNYPFRQFNNFSVGMDSSQSPPYGGSPMTSSFPEPGQGFFDLSPKHDMSSSVPDLVALDPSSPSFSNNMNGPFLNPHVAPFQPPPLVSASPLLPYQEDPEQQQQLGGSTVDKAAISEYCESDSGVSLDHSPKGFTFMGSSVVDDASYNARESQLNDHEQAFHRQDLKSMPLTHNYNDVSVVKRQINKKKQDKAQIRESRDEKKARELNLPFTLEEIILSPVEDYNEMLVRTPLNPSQQALIKDIRRRGKNKVAAQNCRKRKIETISNMEDDVDVLRSRKQQLVDEQNELDDEKDQMKMRYNALYQQIFSSLRDDSGRPYDPNHFRLEQVEGAVILVPHSRHSNRTLEQDEVSRNIDFSKVKTEKSR